MRLTCDVKLGFFCAWIVFQFVRNIVKHFFENIIKNLKFLIFHRKLEYLSKKQILPEIRQNKFVSLNSASYNTQNIFLLVECEFIPCFSSWVPFWDKASLEICLVDVNIFRTRMLERICWNLSDIFWNKLRM